MKASIAGIVAGLLLTAGCGGVSDSQSAPASDEVVTPTAPQPADARTRPEPPGTLAAPQLSSRAAAPQPVKPANEARPPARKAAPGEPLFWRLIAETRKQAGTDSDEQSGLLEERLRTLSPQAILDFARFRQRLDRGLYTWKLWGAAYVIEDGCSDDCFRDFRGYVISLGRGAYQKAQSNPDSLASVVQDAETGNWENADNVAPDAYSGVTGGDFPLDDSDLSGSPRGKPFNENNGAALARRYPRLAARFR